MKEELGKSTSKQVLNKYKSKIEGMDVRVSKL